MSNATHGGKGDRPRIIEDRVQYDNNWDRIFGSKKKEEDIIAALPDPVAREIENHVRTKIEVEAANTEAEIQQKLVDMGWTPPADKEIDTTENFARKMREWNMMYDCLQNIHLYEYPLEEVKELLKQIKIS